MSKKKRKNKSAVALLQKRKSFANVFIKRLIIMIIVWVLAFTTAKELFVKDTYITWEDAYDSANNAIINTINKGPLDESYEMFMNRVEFAMAMRQEMRTASILVNAETKEIIADCNEQIFLMKKRDVGKSVIYACPTANIEGWSEYREKLVASMGASYFLSEELYLDYIYVSGYEYIPGEFKIINRAYDVKTGESTDVLKDAITTKFEEPKNISLDYVKVNLNDSWTMKLIYGYNEKNIETDSGLYKAYEILQENYQHFLESGETYLGGEYYTEDKMILSGEREINMPNGEKAILMSVYYFDAWDLYGTQIIIAGVLSFVVAIIVSLIWAKLSHMKLKAQYDMEDYRKTLMNTMAHDLKSPLMSISGYAENLRNNINTDKREHYSEAILGNVKYMNHIIESVLALGKTENLDLTLKKVKTSIKPLIAECAKKYDLQMKENNLTFNIEGDVELDIDVSLFTQAMDNLVGNAVKYACSDSAIRVSIKDDMIALANQCDDVLDVDVATLCEPFVVGNENRSEKCGSGLGLTIVKNICKLHGFQFELKHEENIFIAEIRKKK